MRCDDLVDVLATVPDGTELSDRRARRHVEGCLRCQAELAQYRRLLRALAALREELLPAPGLADDILASLDDLAERAAVRGLFHSPVVAYAGLAVATTATAAAAAAVLLNRTKRSRLKLAG